MRTKLLTVLVFMFTYLNIFPKPIDINTAKQVGANFLTSKTKVQGNTSNLTLAYTIQDQNENNYFYIFNVNQHGFVIVAGDDDVSPILGYSDQGIFNNENIAPSVKKWLENYKEQIRHVANQHIPATEEIKAEWESLQKNNCASRTAQSTSTLTSVSPLIQTYWDQSPYYNELCPLDSNYEENTVTGCVATAMAQIMKYWGYPSQGTGFHSYNHESYGTLSANFGATTYDWTSMPNSISSSNDAIATLMYHCGVSVNMNYGVGSTGGSGASGTPAVAPALINYFDYPSSTIEIRQNYTDDVWINILKQELDAGRPMYYQGSGNSTGHAFVCDGYDTNDFFHMNWGWSGLFDGYFNLDSLNPDGTGIGGGTGTYNFNQSIVKNIQPANNETTQNYDLQLYSDLNMTDTEIWFGDDFSISIDIANYGTGSFTGQIGAAIFDSNNNFIDFMEVDNSVTIQNGFYNTYSFNNTSSTLFVPGTYYVAVFYKNTIQNWTIVSEGDYTNFEEFEIYYSSDIETNSEFSITSGEGILYQGQSATINVDILNSDSDTFYGNYRVLLANLDGSPAQNIQILNENNGLPYNYHYTNGLNFTGDITVSPGTYLLEIAYQLQGSSTWYYAGSNDFQNPVFVTVQTPPISPDMYENNNSFEQSYTFSPTFSSYETNVITTASNIHVGDDNDYYKVSCPTGSTYNISARLQDSYDSNDGNLYSVDALFSYSTDNGATWSDVYDTIVENNIIMQDGGEIIFHVAPYFSGDTGSYLLDIDISTQTLSIADFDIMNEIKIYPNPAKNFATIDFSRFADEVSEIQIYNLQGQIISTLKTNNESSIEIPLQNLSNGVYFVQIYSTKGMSTKKLIKN